MRSFDGMPVVENVFLTVPEEDWSEVRSHSRARRRMKNGHKQRVRYLQLPNPQLFIMDGRIHGHPETIRQMFALASLAESKAGA